MSNFQYSMFKYEACSDKFNAAFSQPGSGDIGSHDPIHQLTELAIFIEGTRFVMYNSSKKITMKRKVLIYLIVMSAGVFGSVNLHAQDTATAGHDMKNAAKKTGKAVKKDAKKVGNKTAEIASKGKSALVDKTYAGKQGPNGEKIFIDGKSKYYYVDKQGHKQYVPESKLKDK